MHCCIQHLYCLFLNVTQQHNVFYIGVSLTFITGLYQETRTPFKTFGFAGEQYFFLSKSTGVQYGLCLKHIPNYIEMPFTVSEIV
jgi:hypothetical protein